MTDTLRGAVELPLTARPITPRPPALPSPIQLRSTPEPHKSWQHGTLAGYNTHRCRCNACRNARRKYVAGLRAR